MRPVEVRTDAVRAEIHGRIPGAAVAVSDLPFSAIERGGRGPGRLLMVDGDTILLSAQREGLVPGERDETGLWGSEVGHGLVAWLRPLLRSRIDRLEFARAE